MTGKGLKTKLVMTFVMMVILAMCLQSMIFLFLGIRAAIKEDVSWSTRVLQAFANISSLHGDGERDRQ